jgi:hypothetical protein
MERTTNQKEKDYFPAVRLPYKSLGFKAEMFYCAWVLGITYFAQALTGTTTE